MRIPVLGVFTGLSLSLMIGAQTTSAPASPGAIGGVVVNANDSSPIRRAIVTLSTVEAQPQDAVAWSDANGRFSFGYLPAGRYQLRVIKDGYQAAVYGGEAFRRPPAIIQLADGQVRRDFIFRLQLINSITGVVLDEDGDPLRGVQVTAMTPSSQNQRRRLLPGAGAITDAAGHYRLTGLAAGRYAVAVNALNRLAFKIHPDVTAGEPQQQYFYGVQYYPAADRVEAAKLITVQPGQEISSIDFRVLARPSASIDGKVLMPPGAARVKDPMLNIVSKDLGNRMVTRSGASPPEYRFSVPMLATGSYVLIALASIDGTQYRGTQSIDLGPQGLHDITISIEPSVDLVGSVSIEGPDAAKHAASFVSLVPGDDIPWNAPPLRASVNKDGSFKIPNVPPGVWDIDAGPIPAGGYLKSMRLGDQDVLTEEMAIRSSTTEPLKIVIGTRAATVEGDVAQGDEATHAVVLLAPDGRFRHVTSFYKFAATDDKGHFEIKGAAPGEYRLYAFEEFDARSIQDPDFLKPFEKSGVPVTLREGPHASQKLTSIPSGPVSGVQQ